DNFELYEKAVNSESVRAFRVNTDKISLEDFEKLNTFSSGKIPYVENGFYLNYDKIGNHPFHHAGMIYVQEPAAMAPAECVEIDPDWAVLDMCAAPGGKSSQIKNKLGENGILVSNEIISSRCKILTGNIERLGFSNCVTTCLDTKKLASLFPNTFDMIMVDAPCSGEGMFRKEQIAIDEWSEENVKMCAARQKEILENAAKCLKSGGYIVYATCTFSLDENEMVVDSFLKEHSEFELCEVTDRVKESTCDGIYFEGCECENIHFARRFYPHVSRGEGQFMAVLRHRGEKLESHKKTARKPEKIDGLVFDFLDDVLQSYDKSQVTIYNQNPVYFTPDFEVLKGAAFSCGVTIGEIKKGYIQPHHQFFMAFGPKFKRKVDLAPDSDDLSRYLHGEEISVDLPNGFAAVTVCGCSVGGGKVVGGRLKNHYPKGLRTK
ncbi:MAG: methyltransferase domain-containing protein, partial [Oscillospiraceae bacterium]|nr:methyltransferase domain-containing protein [Oscillospiraceae bacterium]